MRAYLWNASCSLIASCLVTACGDPPPTTSGTSPSSASDDAGPMEVVVETGECEVDGTVEVCDCPGDAPDGTRSCIAGYWDPCTCQIQEVATVGDCKPGRYEGEFFGYYFSSFAGAFSPIPAPIPVYALGGLDGKPGLAFTLNSNGAAPEPGVEFAPELEISDGYVNGTADGLFPFKGTLTGKLDCRTKQLKATLSGHYAIVLEVQGLSTADFEGPVLGHYDVGTDAFPCQQGGKMFPKCDDAVEARALLATTDVIGGSPYPRKEFPSTWDLTENTTLTTPYPNIPYGGKGYWSAQWVGEGSVDTTTGQPSP